MGKLVPLDVIENKIFQVREKRVMLDRDLAVLYEVETRVLNQAVKRNIRRFPGDFMFSLTREEIRRISQIVTSLKFYKSINVFTEQGVSMLSSVLHSERAIDVNIQIMRAFVNLRRVAVTYSGLKNKIESMEKKYDKQFGVVFKAIRQLMEPPPAKARVIAGFKQT